LIYLKTLKENSMPAVINTNLASLLAQNSLSNAQMNLATSVQRLSSGLRINGAKDDASGLSIAQTMAGHIKSLDQASLNAQQATNLAQTADTSLSTTQDILLRMQQLAVEGSNSSLSNTQRAAIVTELGNLNTQINAFASGTTYNGIKLMGADATKSGTGLGSTSDSYVVNSQTATIGAAAISANTAAGIYTISASGSALTMGNGNVTQTITLTAVAANTTSTFSFSNLGISFTVAADSAGVAAGASVGAVATALNSDTLTVTSGGTSSLAFQIGSSPTASGDTIALSTANTSSANGNITNMLSVGTLVTGALTDLAANASATGSAWTTAFQSLQTATSSSINDISSLRATVGSAINQLGYINNNLVAQSANEQAARSTIVDTNYSAETSELTKGQILQQAATAMLAQANQMPNVILSLLK